MGLGTGRMDAASFMAVRIVAGAVVLAVLVRARSGSWQALRGRGGGLGVTGPVALVAYAAPFSFAYVRIGAAAGALILFGSVQLTMIAWGLARGERPGARTWLGLALAAAGLAWLTVPAISRPDPVGSVLMVVAGGAWGAYSIAGKRAPDALAANARSFVWAAPLALAIAAVAAASSSLKVDPRGVGLALVSGGVTSGLGYAIWYRALRGLTATKAAILQLAVPIIAALGAVALLQERVNPRLGVAGLAVLGGVALALTARRTPG
jgi:drug/metabolite transporter (DMT)-like permease